MWWEKKDYNPDWQFRDDVIFGIEPEEKRKEAYKWGGIRHFNGLNYKSLCILIGTGFADPEERQNESPSIREIAAFMMKYPAFTAHGYTVSFDRDDYRISIEGVDGSEAELNNVQMIKDFIELFGNADELNADNLYCWFD